ncbi:hypothetical protein [Agrococcus sp. ProA11]|uniref:DUF6993 domain-containing protein n=1 Tax=Agrococcus chionoecetis TaxID=3153752 RepID=UPI003260ACD4
MRRSAVLVLLAALSLVGCSPSPEPAASASAQPSATAATAPAAESADDELAAFRSALGGQSPLDPESLVDAVETAGFARSTIERTREVDSLGAPVTFLEIAVRVDDGCLIGQVGDGPAAAIRAAALGGGRCLVGDVIALD